MLVGLAAVVVYRGVASVEQGARGWCMRRAGACGWLVWLVQHAHGGAGPFFSAFFFCFVRVERAGPRASKGRMVEVTRYSLLVTHSLTLGRI